MASVVEEKIDAFLHSGPFAVVGPAQELNHHPDIAFGWGYVRITLTTHDAGGITDLDHRLAKAIDTAVKPLHP